MFPTPEMIAAWQRQQKEVEKQVTISLDNDIFNSIRIEGDFILTSGRKSNYFYDFERLSPNYMTIVSGLLHEKFKTNLCGFEFVVGPSYGGIIPGYLVADFSDSQFISFDPKKGEFRGQVKKMDGRFVVIDDVISTYGTVDATIKAVADHNPVARCVGVGCFVFRGEAVRAGDPRTFFLHRGEIEI